MTRSIERTAIWVGALLLFAMLVAACAPAPTPAPQPVAPSPTPLALPSALPTVASSPAQPVGTGTELTGASLFLLSCSACHGQDLAGSTFDDEGQKISVPALAWDDLNSTYSTDTSRGTVEQQLALAITKGQAEDGTDLEPMMPRWSSFSQSQVDSLIQFMQAGAPAPANLGPEAASLTGEQLYQAACAACHGADAAGKDFESDGNTISTPSLHWADLSGMYASDPSRGSVEAQVALAITKGQDEEGGDLNAMMPRWTFLSQAQVDSLVQYLQTAFP